MNDDLISRKAVLDVLNDVDQDGLLKISQIIDFIKDQPTAFNKEKVIKKLKDQYNYSRKVRNKNDNNYFEYWDGRTDSYKDAIKIVEKGGIE